MKLQTSKTQINFFIDRLPAIFLSVFILFFSSISAANIGADWLLSQTTSEGGYASTIDIATPVQSTAETLLALKGLDAISLSRLQTAVSYLNAETYNSTEYLSRTILSNALTGRDSSALMADLLNHSNSDGGFGEFSHYDSTTLDSAFALMALAADDSASERIAAAIAFIIEQQHVDGSFSLGNTNKSSTYIAALTSIALQQYQFNYNLSAQIDAVTAYLKASQFPSGGWATDWETALALIAIIPVTTDTTQYADALTSLQAAQLSNGSWDENVYTTALALRALTLAATVQFPQDPDSGLFSGKVIDDVSHQPLAGVSVTATGNSILTQVTEADGSFVFDNIQPGTYTFDYVKEGYISATQSASVAAGQQNNLGSIRLNQLSNTGIINGLVTDATTGLPLSNVLIETSGALIASFTTVDDGRLQLVSAPGAITVSASADGYQTVNATGTIVAGSTLIFAPALYASDTVIDDPGVQIIGTVVDESTKTALSATITVLNTSYSTYSDDTGIFEFRGVDAGELSIEITASGYFTYTAQVLAPAGSTIDMGQVRLLRQSQSTQVGGLVTDSSTGEPIAGANVFITGTTTGAVTAQDGRYLIDNISNLNFTLSVNAVGYLSNTATVQLADHGLATVDLTLITAQANNISIINAYTEHSSYPAYGEAEIHVVFQNSDVSDRDIIPYVKVINSNGDIVEQFPGIPAGVNTLAAGALLLPANSDYAAEYEWYTQATPADNYQLIVQAFDAVTHQLLAERGVAVDIETTQAISGHISFDPPIVQLAANKAVNINAQLASKANVTIPATTVTATVSLLNEGYTQRTTGVEIETLLQDNGLNNPGATEIDSNGNIYLINRAVRAVLKISPEGDVSEILTGLTSPRDLDIGPQGELYILEYNNYFIRIDTNGNQQKIQTGLYGSQAIEVLADGRVFIVKGNSLYEIAEDGTPTQIIGGGLASPESLVMNSQGTIFVASRADNSISRYANGEVTTFATGISQPYGMDIDTQDNIYVVSSGSGSLLKVTPAGEVSTIASGLKGPRDVKISPNGDLIVSNNGNHEILSITLAGEISVLVPATFYRPNAATYDAADNLYVANQSFRNITRITPDGEMTVVANALSVSDILSNTDDSLALLESKRIRELDSDGALTELGRGLSSATSLLHAPNGNGYLVSESSKHRIVRMDGSGQLSSYIEPLFDSNTATLQTDTLGNKFILNYASNGYLSKISSSGVVSRYASGLSYARDMSFAADGGIYITEYNKKRVLYIDTNGNTSVYANLDFNPGGITLTADGLVLVARYGGKILYEVNPTGAVEYITLDYPVYNALMTDAEGTLWAGHHVFRRITKVNTQGLIENYHIGNYVTALESDGAGGVYIAGSSSISHISSVGEVNKLISGNYLQGQILNGIAQDLAGHFWVTSTNGLLFDIDNEGLLLKRYSTIKAPRSMAYDASGNLIVVNGNSTVVRISSPVKLPEVIVEGNYNKVRYVSTGALLLSTTTTVKRVDLASDEITTLASGFSNIQALAENGNGILAVGDYAKNQLALFSMADGTEIDRHTGLVSPGGLLFDTHGQLLVSNTYPNNISKVLDNGRIEAFSPIKSVRYMYLETDGSLLASNNGQLAHVSATGSLLSTIKSTHAMGLIRDSEGKLLVASSSPSGLLEYAADNSYHLVATGLSSPVDIEADNSGILYIADKKTSVVNAISASNGLILTESGLPNISRIVFSSHNELFMAYGRNKIRALDNEGQRTELPISGLIIATIKGLAVDANDNLIGSVDTKNLLFRLLFNNDSTELAIGDVVYSVTLGIDELTPGLDTLKLDLGNFTPRQSGDYRVELIVNDAQTENTLSNNLHVGPNAHGSIALAQSKVFPGDHLVSGSMSIFGADSTSITRIEPDGTTLAASSYTNGRGIAADSSGNIYSSDRNRLVKITPTGELSDFVTGISLGNGLAVDNDDNIYAGSGKHILKISQDAQVQTIATLVGTVNAVAVNNNGELFAVDSNQRLSRIHQDGSIELITSTGLSDPRALTIDVNGYFYVLNRTLVRNEDDTIGNLIVRISPDGSTVSEYYSGARFEFEGVNVTADCSNNLLFAPASSLGVSEESKIFQHIGATGEVREVLYGPSIDPAMADMDVLFYDRLGDRLLIWTDLNNGKIFSFPTSCGGIDAEVHLITRADVDLMNTDPAPTGFSELPDGNKEYIWLLSEVDNRGENILLNFQFTDLLDGETRPALQQAYIQFNNSFVADADIRVPLQIPTLLASSQMSLNSTLDRSRYGANDNVQITANVGNDSGTSFDGLLKLTVQDSSGIAVVHLADISINQLTGLQTSSYLSEWLTGNTYTGDYQIYVQLFNSIGEQVAEQTIQFEVVPNLVDASTIEVKVTTDKLIYAAWDQVLINARVRNIADNAIQPDSSIEISISNPDNILLYSDSAALGELFPGNLRDVPFSFKLIDALAGEYQLTLRLRDASSEVISTDHTVFKVVRSIEQGITGSVTVMASQLIAGEANVCITSLTNLASTDLIGTTVYQRIYNMDTGELTSDSSQIIDIHAHDSHSQSQSIDSTDYLEGAYACVLQIGTAGELIEVAAAGFNILADSTGTHIDIKSSITAAERGRILVLIDQDSTTEDVSCTGLSQLQLSTDFDIPLQAAATLLTAELSDTLSVIDSESALLQSDTLPVNANTSSGDADLLISAYDISTLTLSIQAAEQVLAERYELNATLSDTDSALNLQTGILDVSCDTALSIGKLYGDFTLSGLTLIAAENDPHGPENMPSPSEQSAYLQQLLDTNGWSYTLVNGAEAFSRELHSGGYSTYMLLSARVKLAEQVQKQLRAAVFRGEGLIEAGSHDQRNGRIDQVLGIKFIGKHAATRGVNLLASDVYSGAEADFMLGADKALRVQMESADVLAYFIDTTGNTTTEISASINSYGQGQALYAGFDLLAEAAAIDSENNPYAEFLLSALNHVHPQQPVAQAGAVYPFTLSLNNQGDATPGRTITVLPQGSHAIDSGQATVVANNTLQWLFQLNEGITVENTFWLRLPTEAGTVTLDTRVQSGNDPDFTDYDSLSISLQTTAMPTLSEAVERLNSLGRNKDYKQAQQAINKAQNKADNGDYPLALKFLTQAADALLAIDTAPADEMRLAVAWAIRDVASRLSIVELKP